MAVLRIIVTIIFILICIALTILVLMQEGKASGLGAISGMAETYWGKNKGRSMEGTMVRVTKYLASGLYCDCRDPEYLKILITKALLPLRKGCFFLISRGFSGSAAAAAGERTVQNGKKRERETDERAWRAVLTIGWKKTEKRRSPRFLKEPSYVPMKEKELACLMQVSAEDRPELRRLLQELILEGRIQINRRGRYSVPDVEPVIGTFIGHPRRASASWRWKGRKDDLYRSAGEDRRRAVHQDTVEVRLLGGFPGGRQEAEVVRILARGMTGVVGTYQQNKSFGFVIPDNSRFGRDIFVPGEKAGGAVSGSKVIVEITDYGGPGKCPEGRVAEILGHANDPGVDILSIVKSCGIPDAFPPEALSEAERAAAGSGGNASAPDRAAAAPEGEAPAAGGTASVSSGAAAGRIFLPGWI